MNQVTSVSQIILLTLTVFVLHINLSFCEEYNEINLHGQMKLRRRDAIRAKNLIDCPKQDQNDDDIVDEEEINRKNKRRLRKCNQDEEVMEELEEAALKSKSKNVVPKKASKSDETYLTWKKQSGYSHSKYLPTEIDESKGIHFHWTINDGQEKYSDTGTIQIGVAVKIDSQQGWAEIGFSDHGGRRGADFVHFTRTGTALPSLVDGYVLDDIYEKPIADKKQDWELIHHSMTKDGYLIFEAKRDLDTKDSFDKPLFDDSNMLASNHMIVGTWGSSPDVYYMDENTVIASLQLFQSDEVPVSSDYDSFRKQMSALSDGSGKITLSSYTIPPEQTKYGEECWEIEKVFGHSPSTKAMYMVGFANIITSKHVHHLGFRFKGNKGEGESDRQMTWTVNSEKFRLLPDGVGKKIGGARNLSFICLKVHYNNSDKVAAVVDSEVGIEFFYSYSPPKYTWYTLEMLSDTHKSRIESGLSRTSFNCPSAFNFPELQQDEFTIFQIILHAHHNAKRIVSQVVRDGEVIHEVSVDYWDYDKKSAVEIVHRPFQVRRTDLLRTTCYLHTTEDIIWGKGSADEMCNTFALFYLEGSDVADPASDRCYFRMPEQVMQLTDESQFNRVFGRDD